MAKCKHCTYRKSVGRPPCKDHRVGQTMEAKSNSRSSGVISAYERQRIRKNVIIALGDKQL